MSDTDLVVSGQGSETALSPASAALPPVLIGSLTPEVRARVESFYGAVPEVFEAWVRRCRSEHTRRSYREGVMAFVRYLGLTWPAEASALLTVPVAEVQAFRDELAQRDAAPKTLNQRVSAVSSFYRYLALCAAELRLPIVVPNPAHSQFIARASSDPREETLALSATRARLLLKLADGKSVFDRRDRAILHLFLYSGLRLAAGCRLQVEDFRHDEEEGATIRLREKGDKRRTIGLHVAAAEAIADYIACADISSGPLFRPQGNSRRRELAEHGMNPRTMWLILKRYLEQLRGALRERRLPNGIVVEECIYTPHSLRATAATLLLDSKVDIMEVKELLGHRRKRPVSTAWTPSGS